MTPATVVDHIIPYKGDTNLFWDTDNWQSLCKLHHDRDKQREERGRFQTVGEDGLPILHLTLGNCANGSSLSVQSC